MVNAIDTLANNSGSFPTTPVVLSTILDDITKLSYGISNAAKAVKKHRALWTSLAEDIAQAVAAATKKVGDTASSNLDDDTLKQIKELRGTLSKASGTLTRMQSRSLINRIKRFFGRNRTALAIQKYRANVNRAKESFKVTSSSSTVPIASNSTPLTRHANPGPRHVSPDRQATFINGDRVENNIKAVTTNINSNQVTAVNKINTHNTYTYE